MFKLHYSAHNAMLMENKITFIFISNFFFKYVITIMKTFYNNV